MDDKLARQLGLTPGLLREIEGVASLVRERGRALGGLAALAPTRSMLVGMEEITGGMKAADLLPAYAKASDQLAHLGGVFERGDKVRDLLGMSRFGAVAQTAEALAGIGDGRKQFQALGGVAIGLVEIGKVAASLGSAMDWTALGLIRDQRGLIDSKAFGGLLADFHKVDSFASSVDTAWGIPAWRPSFERLANISLARDIGVWRSRSSASPVADDAGEEFVHLRSDQAEDDAAQLDELVHALMPSLYQPIAGARLILERRSIDYRTQFAASARKAIDLTLQQMAPAGDVSEWVQADPTAPKRKKGGRGNVTFRERVAFLFRNASEPAREFFTANIDGIVVLRKELSDLDHDNGEDPHPRLIENRQLVERLLLQILQEQRRLSRT